MFMVEVYGKKAPPDKRAGPCLQKLIHLNKHAAQSVLGKQGKKWRKTKEEKTSSQGGESNPQPSP